MWEPEGTNKYDLHLETTEINITGGTRSSKCGGKMEMNRHLRGGGNSVCIFNVKCNLLSMWCI